MLSFSTLGSVIDKSGSIKIQEKGAFRESNSGPLAPKARIIPLDQMPICFQGGTTLNEQ